MTEIPIVTYPKPWALLWVCDVLAVGYVCYTLYRKWRGWSRGMDLQVLSRGERGHVLSIWLSEVLFQRQLLALSHFRWLSHLFISWGFIALALLSIFSSVLRSLASVGMDGGFARYLFHGEGYIIAKIWGNSFGLMLLVGLAFAIVRRFLMRPPQIDNRESDALLLFFLLWLTLSGFVLEGLRLALVPAEVARYSYVSSIMSLGISVTREEAEPWLTALWTLHGMSGIALLVYMPHSKLLHSILAPLIIGLNALSEHKREDLYWPDVSRHKVIR